MLMLFTLSIARLGSALFAGATGVSLAWPAMRNYNTYRGASGGAAFTHHKVWLDQTKPPFTNG